MTEAELIEEKREERKKLIDEVKRRRAIAAQSEGILGAAEQGEYGDVGQGEPKGEFDDEINQDPGNEDPSQSSMTQQAKNFLANYFTRAKFGATGAGMEGMARIQAFLADKKIPFTDKDVTDIFMLISQAPDREKFTNEDIGKVIGMGEFVTEDMVNKNKPLTIGQVPGYLGNLMFSGTAEDMRKVRDEGLTVDEMTPGQIANMAAGLSEFSPFGFASDIYRIGKSGVKEGVKAINEMITPLNQMQTAGGPNVNMMTKVGDEGSNVVNKVNEKIDLNDIYTNPLKRKDRVKLRNEAVNDKDLNNLANQINKEKRYSEDTISKFIEIYNSGNPFKIEQLRSMTGNQFKSILTKVGPNGTNKINQKTIDLNKNLLDSKIESITDVRVSKLEEQLKKYKGNNPKETGMNLRVNKFGEFDINDIFKLDDDLKYLVNNKSERQRILKRLEKEGILDELGLTDINIKANKPKTISDPQIDQYLKDLNLNFLPKKFDFTSKILNPKQKEIYNNLQNKVTKSMGESDKAVYDIIRENVNRMIKYGVRDKGKSIDEVIASLQKQTDNPEFLEEVIPLIQKKIKAQKNIEKFREIGIDLDNVNLSHMTAVVDDIDQTFKLNNIFIGLSKKNTAESVIQKKIKNLNKQLDEKGGSVANKNKIKADIEDLQYELKTGNYYESVPETYIEDELFFSEMMRTGASPKKDGGMVGISHLTRPLGKFSSQI
jgi:hypothetical protein